MNFSIEQRIQVLEAVGDYITSQDIDWEHAKSMAISANPWFTEESINNASRNIAKQFCTKNQLIKIKEKYNLDENNFHPKKVGIVMAGNIPLVGFHDFMAVLISGHSMILKLSSKDSYLWQSILKFIKNSFSDFSMSIESQDRLNECDAYIATGSDSSVPFFKQYFGNKPHIVRGHRNAVAILAGNETPDELLALADDVHLYFGMGCRNVTKIFVPVDYDFEPMLQAFKKYTKYEWHNKYKNNYDYQLSMYILNRDFYMSNGTIILKENESIASPISVLYYSYYENISKVTESLDLSKIQCIVGKGFLPFGESQNPDVFDFADNMDNFQFCKNL